MTLLFQLVLMLLGAQHDVTSQAPLVLELNLSNCNVTDFSRSISEAGQQQEFERCSRDGANFTSGRTPPSITALPDAVIMTGVNDAALELINYATMIKSIPVFYCPLTSASDEDDIDHEKALARNLMRSTFDLIKSSTALQRIGIVAARYDRACSNFIDIVLHHHDEYFTNGSSINIVALHVLDREPPSEAQLQNALVNLKTRGARAIIFCLGSIENELRFLQVAEQLKMLTTSGTVLFFRPSTIGGIGRQRTAATVLNFTDAALLLQQQPVFFVAPPPPLALNDDDGTEHNNSNIFSDWFTKSIINTLSNNNNQRSGIHAHAVDEKSEFVFELRRYFNDGAHAPLMRTVSNHWVVVLDNNNNNDSTPTDGKFPFFLSFPSSSSSLTPLDAAQSSNNRVGVVVGAVCGAAAAGSIILFGLAYYFFLRHYYRQRYRVAQLATTTTMQWRIDFSELQFTLMLTTASNNNNSSNTEDTHSLHGIAPTNSYADDDVDNMNSANSNNPTATNIKHHMWIARYKLQKVRVNALSVATIKIDADLTNDMYLLRSIISGNVARFIGVCTEDEKCCIVWEFAAKGCLRSMIDRSRVITIDRTFQLSIMSDIARGLLYLHRSALGSHGLLNSYTCVVDDKFAVKVADFGIGRLRRITADAAAAAAGAVKTSALFAPRAPSTNTEQSKNATSSSSASLTSDSRNATSKSVSAEDTSAMMSSMVGGGRGMVLCVYCNSSNMRMLLWYAPELLRLPNDQRPLNGTPQADIYAYGMVVWELLTRCELHHQQQLGSGDGDYTNTEDILRGVRNGLKPPLRPSFPTSSSVTAAAAGDTSLTVPQQSLREPLLMDLARACWHELPSARPTAHNVLNRLKSMCGGRLPDITHDLLERLKSYAQDLETVVSERSAALGQEKQKFEAMLYQMIPRSVAEELLRTGRVEPRAFASVTICFSEVADFNALTALYTPLQIVDMLNALYTSLDNAIDSFDVYKVESIGGNVMLAGGVPTPSATANAHAYECGRAAMAIFHMTMPTILVNMQQEKDEGSASVSTKKLKFRMRTGIHTGACVAGIIGIKMPRYCLFGDTVNTASRMQSTGVADRVQVSGEFVFAAKTFASLAGNRHLPALSFSVRGNVDIKGKGMMQTYWLTGYE